MRKKHSLFRSHTLSGSPSWFVFGMKWCFCHNLVFMSILPLSSRKVFSRKDNFKLSYLVRLEIEYSLLLLLSLSWIVLWLTRGEETVTEYYTNSEWNTSARQKHKPGALIWSNTHISSTCLKALFFPTLLDLPNLLILCSHYCECYMADSVGLDPPVIHSN